eukprot:scaffold114357_cov81-Cyclotella_meneghiniana.AAC.2
MTPVTITPAITEQYANFRPSPQHFPSYDRLHFIRLDTKLLPPSVTSDDTASSLTHYPCLLYHTIPELIRDTALDLPTKHSLIKEWRKEPKSVVRLIGWRDTVPEEGVYFPDSSVDLIRLVPDSDRLLDFYQSLESFEAACATLETQYRDVLEVIPDDADALQTKQFCQRWRASVWYSLNMLAMDLGEGILPFNAGNTVDSNNSAAAAAAVKSGKNGKRKALEDVANKKKPKVDKSTTLKKSSADTPSVPMSNIQPHTPWSTVWKILRSNGWNWRAGSGLMTDYYYIKPGKKIKGGIEKTDYFVKVEDVQDFCRKEYGWIGEKEADATTAAEETDDSKNDNAEIPPLINALDPYSSWRTAWNVLLSSGWSWKIGSGLMTDYYYIKPGKKVKGGVANVDYFADRASLEEYMKRCYGWVGEDGKPEEEMLHYDEPTKSSKKASKVKTVDNEEPTKAAKAMAEKRESLDFDDDVEQNNKKQKLAKITVQKSKSKPSKPTTIEEEAPYKEIKPCFVADWRMLWPQLESQGWDVRKAGKYNRLHDWYWVRPGVDPADPDAMLGEHYFLSEEDAMNFVSGVNNKDVDTRAKAENKPNAATPKAESTFDEEWKTLWSQLKNEGWTVEQAGSNKYWVRPWVSLASTTAKLGEDYFSSENDVMKFVNSSYRRDSAVSSSDTATATEKPVNTFKADWKELWPQLKAEGWTWMKAGKFCCLHDWYWVRPGCDPGDKETELGRDYFLSESDVIDFVKASGWTSSETPYTQIAKSDTVTVSSSRKSPVKIQSISNTPAKLSSRTNSDPQTPVDCKTKPQDPAIPLPPSPESSTASDEDSYAWDNLWPRLQIAGWKVIKAGKYCKLHDYYYVRPNRDPGEESSELGKHYFQTKEEVIQFERMREENGGTKSPRTSMDVMQRFFENEALS